MERGLGENKVSEWKGLRFPVEIMVDKERVVNEHLSHKDTSKAQKFPGIVTSLALPGVRNCSGDKGL